MANLVGSSTNSNGLTSLQSELSTSLMSYALSSANNNHNSNYNNNNNSNTIKNQKKNGFALEAISLLLSKDQPQEQQDSFLHFLITPQHNNKSPILSIIEEVLSPISKFTTGEEEEWMLNLLCTIIERIFSIKPSISQILFPEILLICSQSIFNKQNNDESNNENNNRNIIIPVVSILYSSILYCESLPNDFQFNNNDNQNNNSIKKSWDIILTALLPISVTTLTSNSSTFQIVSLKVGWILSVIVFKV